MSARSTSRNDLRSIGFAIALAFTASLGCSKSEAKLPEDPATPGAFIAARESATGRYRLYRVLAADPLPPPIGTKLHLVAYDETTADFKEAKRVVKHTALTPIHENVIVLGRDFFERDHRVVGFRPVQKDERGKPTAKRGD